jgi:uncharacterized membrane protein YbaN (DUF454 family)
MYKSVFTILFLFFFKKKKKKIEQYLTNDVYFKMNGVF